MIPTMQATTFHGIARLIGSRTDRVTIGHNTTAERDGAAIVVRYHGHAIVAMTPDMIALDDCGYMTATTKTRLNLFAPAGVSIWQKAHRWWISTGQGEPSEWNGCAIFATA